MSKFLKNVFWKQVFGTIIDITEGAAFTYPEKLLSSPFFHNNLVLRNNKVIKEGNYPEIVDKVTSLSDFFNPGTNQLLQRAEFCERHGSNISEEKYIEIRYVIKLAIQKLKISINRLYPAYYPQKPFLIDLVLLSNKGCQPYYSLLRKKFTLSNNIYKRENKWHEELGSIFSVGFWNSTRKLCSCIDFDNKLKWLQYQVIRNSLQTNFIVSHFKANISSKCGYCQESDELISHIFWTCRVVKTFFAEIIAYFAGINIDFSPSRTELLFGFHNQELTHPKNLISLVFK